MKAKKLPSQSRLRELFDYNPKTGVLLRLATSKEAGWFESSNGYRCVSADGERYLVHRIIYVWMVGESPRSVDHIDLNKTNNRWANLRECSKTENQGNRSARRDNTLGVKGVHFDASRNRFVAQIARSGQFFYIGRFKTLEEAKTAYANKAAKVYGEFARVA